MHAREILRNIIGKQKYKTLETGKILYQITEMCVLKSNRCKNSHVVYNKGIKTPKSTMEAIASEHTKNLGKNPFKPFTDNSVLHA